MKKTTTNLLLILSLFLGFNFTFGQTVFYTESFENNAVGYTFTANSGMDTQDFFERTDLAGAPAQEIFTYNGFDGDFFIAGEDINGIAGGTGSSIGEVLISNINIFGQTALEFTAAFASGTNIDIDPLNDAMWVEVNIDGTGWVEIGRFEADISSGFNSQFAQDTNGDGIGDGALLNGAFTDFTFLIVGTGSLMNVRVSMNLNSGDEEAAFDNVRIAGILAPTPTITVTPTSLSGFTYLQNNGPSAEQSFMIEGSSLTNDITINPSVNFEISLFSGTFPIVPAAITLTQTLGIVPPTQIYVRQKKFLLAFGSPYAESLECQSTGATTVNLSVDGTVTLAPPCTVLAASLVVNFQDFEGGAASMPYTQTNTAISTGSGLFPNDPKYATGAQGIEVNNNTGSIIFDTIDATFYSNIEFSIRLASFSGTSTNGSDSLDGVRISISEDGGSTYSKELIVNGNSNAKWSFTSGTGLASTAYDGDDTATAFQPAGGGNRTTDGYSTLVVSDLPASSQLRIKIDFRNNNTNEFWVLDDAALKVDIIDGSLWNGVTWLPSAPTYLTKAFFNANYDMSIALLPSITTCECKVLSGNTVTVTAGKYLEIGNNLINDGAIIVEHEGSIVQLNDDTTVSGNPITVEKTTTPYVMYDYTYWSSPINNATLGTVFAVNPSNRIYDFTTANFDDTDGDTFDDNNDDWNVASGTMNIGQGYIAMGEGAIFPVPAVIPTTPSQQDVSFNGTINNGVINTTVTLDANSTDAFINQNLIGNPYPSAIDASIFLIANSNLGGTLYFWTHNTQVSTLIPGPDTYNFTNDDYMTYVGGTGFVASACSGCVVPADDLIASGQGFFADVTPTGAGTVKFNNAMRVSTGNDNFFRTPNQAKDRVWINFTNEDGMFRQTLIGFFNDATNGHDRNYDGKRLENGNNFDFYTLMNSTRYAIQGFPTLVDQKIVSLGIEAPLIGSFQISIDRFEGDLENVNIYLNDNLLNTIHDLKTANYNLDINQIGEFNTRFELIFSRTALTVNNEITPNSDLIVSNLEDGIHFEMRNESTISKVQAYDVIGKLIVQANPNNSNFNIPTTVKKGTILFIKVQLENGQTLTKKFIKL